MRWLFFIMVFSLAVIAGDDEPKIVLKDGSTIKVDKGAVGTEKNMLAFRTDSTKMLLSKALVDWAATWQKMPEMVTRYKPEIAAKQTKHVRRKTNIAITNESLSKLEKDQGLTDEWTQDKETVIAMARAKAAKAEAAKADAANPGKTRETKRKDAPKSKKGSAIIDVITRGEEVILQDHLEKDKYVIFDFYADWCGPCKRLDPKVKALVKKYPNHIALKKIDIIRWQTPVARQYRVNSIPYLKLYDPSGKEIMDGGGQGILSYLEQTARKKKW